MLIDVLLIFSFECFWEAFFDLSGIFFILLFLFLFFFFEDMGFFFILFFCLFFLSGFFNLLFFSLDCFGVLDVEFENRFLTLVFLVFFWSFLLVILIFLLLRFLEWEWAIVVWGFFFGFFLFVVFSYCVDEMLLIFMFRGVGVVYFRVKFVRGVVVVILFF